MQPHQSLRTVVVYAIKCDNVNQWIYIVMFSWSKCLMLRFSYYFSILINHSFDIITNTVFAIHYLITICSIKKQNKYACFFALQLSFIIRITESKVFLVWPRHNNYNTYVQDKLMVNIVLIILKIQLLIKVVFCHITCSIPECIHGLALHPKFMQ